MEINPPRSSFGRKAVKAFFIPIIIAAIGFVVWMWWPDSTKLANYANAGDVSGVQRCLRLGVDPNKPMLFGQAKIPGPTPLNAAAQSGQVEVIKVLLANGANPNLRNFGPEHSVNTPLATAAMHGQLEACKALLDAKADPNLPCTPNDPGEWGNWTALDWALQADKPEVADLLRKHGGKEGHRGGKAPTSKRPFP